MNWNTVVPCSVLVAVAGIIVDTVVDPNLRLFTVPAGPFPDIVAVTSVPTGPMVGESVSDGVVRDQLTVAVLPWLSAKVKVPVGVPAGSPGRLTVPVYAPDVSALELKVPGVPVTVPD